MTNECNMNTIQYGRSAIYEYLTMCFYDPSDPIFIEQSKKYAPYFKDIAAESENKEFINSSEAFYNLITNIEDSIETQDIISCGYTASFLLGEYSVATAESVYLSPTKLTKQEPWEDIIAVYSANNFAVPDDMHISEEHISAELLFLSYMADKTAKSFEQHDDKESMKLLKIQLNFLNSHLIKWIPAMCKKIKQIPYENSIIYIALADLLISYLNYDISLLQKMIFQDN